MYFKDGFGKLSQLETLCMGNIQWNCPSDWSELHIRITSIVANYSVHCIQIFQFLLVLWELAWNFWFYLHNPCSFISFIYLICYISAGKTISFNDTSVTMKYKAHVKDSWEFGSVINVFPASPPPIFEVLIPWGQTFKRQWGYRSWYDVGKSSFYQIGENLLSWKSWQFDPGWLISCPRWGEEEIMWTANYPQNLQRLRLRLLEKLFF